MGLGLRVVVISTVSIVTVLTTSMFTDWVSRFWSLGF